MVLYSELMNSFNFNQIKTCNYLNVTMCVYIDTGTFLMYSTLYLLYEFEFFLLKVPIYQFATQMSDTSQTSLSQPTPAKKSKK